MRGRSLGAAVFACLAFLLIGCLGGSSTAVAQAPQQEEKPLNFANEQRLDEHWRKHGLNTREFNPVLTKEQYLQRARALFTSDAPEIEKKERNGDFLRYRPSTNEFGVVSKHRVIRTYFRPDSGRRYWDRQ
jgi:pyocin large subunit-like protein